MKKVVTRKTSRGARQKLKVIGQSNPRRLMGNAVQYVGSLAVRDVEGTVGELLASVEKAEQALAAGHTRAALSHAFETSERLVEMARRGGERDEEMTQAAERAKSVVMRVLAEC